MVTSTVQRPPAVKSGVDTSDVVVVAVTYNSEDVVETFLNAMPDALEELDSAQVIVVDNASHDRTVELIRRAAPWVTVLEAGGNLGYGAGINVGLRHCAARHGVMVLNPDTVPARGCLRRLLDAVKGDPGVGIAVPRIVDPEGGLNRSLRREPTILRAFGEAILGGRRAARFAALSETIRAEDYVDGAEADWATGAAMFITRQAIDAAGMWPEDYFLYSEETDYALRVRDSGLRLRLVADAEVVHRGGELSRSPWLWSLRAVNRTRLYRRRHGAVASSFYWCAVVLNEGIRSARGRPTHRAALRALFFGHQQHRDEAR